MDSSEMDKLLKDGIAELKKLRPRKRRLGLVNDRGGVDCLHEEPAARIVAGRENVLPFTRTE